MEFSEILQVNAGHRWFVLVPSCLRNHNAVVVYWPPKQVLYIFDVNEVSKQKKYFRIFFRKKREHCLKAFGSLQSRGVCKTRELLLLYCLVWFHNLKKLLRVYLYMILPFTNFLSIFLERVNPLPWQTLLAGSLEGANEAYRLLKN